MPFLLDSPRVLNCFDIEVRENPQLAAKKEIPRIDPLGKVPVGYADENLNLRFRVLDTVTGKPRSTKDVTPCSAIPGPAKIPGGGSSAIW